MILEVPDSIVERTGYSADELVFRMVVGLLSQGKLTLGQTAAAVKLSKPELMDAMCERGIPMPYDAEDAKKDLETVRQLWPAAMG